MGFNFKKALEFVGYHRPQYERSIADMYYKKMEDDDMEPVVFNPPFGITLGDDHGHATDDGVQGWWTDSEENEENEAIWEDSKHYTKYKDGKVVESRNVDKEYGGSSEKYDENGKVIEYKYYYPNQKLKRISFNNNYSTPDELTQIEYHPSGRVESETFGTNSNGDYITLYYLDHDKKFLSQKWIKNQAYNKEWIKDGYGRNGKSTYTKYRISYYAQTNQPNVEMFDDVDSGIKTTINYDREGNIINKEEVESNYTL